MDSEGVSEGMCRSPKRARASPSPRNVHRHAGTPPLRPTQPSSSSLSRSSSYGLTRAGSTSSSSSSAAHGHVPQPQPSSPRPPPPPPLDLPNDEPPQNPQLASPLHWNPPDANPVAHAATSPCRSPRVREKASGWKRSQRRREMSVPLLSQTLSHFSLSHSHSTLPFAPGPSTSPEAMTHDASSSTPPTLSTPATETDTPRRLPRLHRLHTPAPLDGRELAYPNTAPMPVIHSLLGSPFTATKTGGFNFDMSSPPSWAPRPNKKRGSSSTASVGEWAKGDEWTEEQDVLPELHDSGSPAFVRQTPRSASSVDADDGSGSCTSNSSYLSSGRHVAQLPRPSVVSIWNDNASFFDTVDPVTPSRQFPGSSKANDAVLSSTGVLQRSPGDDSPLMSKRTLAAEPSHSIGADLSHPFFVSRIGSTSSAAKRTQDESLSRSTGYLNQRSKAARPRKASFDGHLHPDAGLPEGVLPRRTSEPFEHSSGDSFAAFLARVGAERNTRSELTPGRPGSPLPNEPSSEPSERDLDYSPLRSVRRTSIPGLPGLPQPLTPGIPHSPSAPSLSLKSRLDKRGASGSSPRPLAKSTPARPKPSRLAGLASRPNARRGATEPQVAKPAPLFGTPVAQLFGDDKPSPAAFASAGLVKKRGGRHSLPRFQEMAKARSWSPMAAPTTSASGTEPPARPRGGSITDTDELDDSIDEEPVSPIRPFRATTSFQRTVSGGHVRLPSTASDNGAFGRPHGHARMSSTASSIGGGRGLRRKGSAMFSSAGSDTMSEMAYSPATPTKPLPLAGIQPKCGISTPSPTSTTSAQYPFARRASIDIASPSTSPFPANRVRQLTRAPVARASNPMLAATFRSHGGLGPSTPVASVAIADGFIPEAARVAGAGRLERDYVLVQALGNGEFSSVWKVRSKADNTTWAIKTGRPYTGTKNRYRQLEEVAVLKQLSRTPHPHIIKFADSWEQSGRLYIRTELGECGDLSRFLLSLGDTGGLGEGRVWKVLVELTSALSFIHKNNILHLDFKPSNVLITLEGSLKVADFGMSTFCTPAYDNNTTPFADFGDSRPFLSSLLDRELEGDREYLAPEILRDATPGPAADVFSLGTLVLEAALNIVLPSNGDAWVKLRNDDFSDIDDHYVERGRTRVMDMGFPGDPPAPVVSATLLATTKHMMTAEPTARMTLHDIGSLPVMQRAREAMITEAGDNPREEAMWKAGPALADEDEGWVEYILGETA